MTSSTTSLGGGVGIDPRALITFANVCEAGTLSGAARRMNVSQPSISLTIGQLEKRLGVTLFERSASGVLLTAEGQALRSRADALKNLIADARRAVDLVRMNMSGPLRIGGTPGALVSLLPHALAHMERSAAGFELTVLERTEAELTGMLRKGEIELALVTTKIDPPPVGITEFTVASDPFALVASAQNAAVSENANLAGLIGLPWILPDAGGGFRRQIDALFLANEIQPPANVLRCDSLLTTKAIVSRTDRVTILPKRVVRPEVASGELKAIEIADSTFTRHIGVRVSAELALSPLAESLIEALSSLE
ncbi:MAG: LysR family transcriptional regulator [Novosphingobium sp.]|nr:LysR family transcriptional regulator [Novosphingobium sp.]